MNSHIYKHLVHIYFISIDKTGLLNLSCAYTIQKQIKKKLKQKQLIDLIVNQWVKLIDLLNYLLIWSSDELIPLKLSNHIFSQIPQTILISVFSSFKSEQK